MVKQLQFLIDKLKEAKELVFTAVGTKSDILSCLPGMPNPGLSSAIKEALVVVFENEMAAVIYMIKPHRATLFGEYADMQLLRYIHSQMTAQRDWRGRFV